MKTLPNLFRMIAQDVLQYRTRKMEISVLPQNTHRSKHFVAYRQMDEEFTGGQALALPVLRLNKHIHMKFLHSLKITVLLMTLICLFCGCASVGRDFKYQNTTSLELGKTSSANYVTMFGKPNAVELKDTSDGHFELVRYLYAYANLGSARTRALDLEFRDGSLNAYHYLSSFDKDKTVVNMDQLKRIERGHSKKNDVLQILGTPHGKARCPTQNADFKDKCSKGTEIWVWTAMAKLSTFGAAFAGDQVAMHNIFIVFDKDDVVSEVESSQTKNL